MHPVESPLIFHSAVSAGVAQDLLHGRPGSGVSGHSSEAQELAQLIIDGDYFGALRHPASFLKTYGAGYPRTEYSDIYIRSNHGPAAATAVYYDFVRTHVVEVVQAAIQQGDEDTLAVILLTGIAALLVFGQLQLTGPTEPPPPALLSFIRQMASEVLGDAPPGAISSSGEVPEEVEAWVTAALQADGEDVAGFVPHLQYLLLAEVLLVDAVQLGAVAPDAAASRTPSSSSNDSRTTTTSPHPSDAPSESSSSVLPGSTAGAAPQLQDMFPTWCWWALRVSSLHQHILAGHSASLLRRSNELSRRLLDWSAYVRAEGGTEGEEPHELAARAAIADGPLGERRLHAVLYMELAQVQHQYGYVEPAKQLLVQAGEILGLSVSLSGALGRRTIHQVDAKAQLTVLASRTCCQANGTEAHDAHGTSSPSGAEQSKRDGDVDVRLLQLGLNIGQAGGSAADGKGEGAGEAAAAAASTTSRRELEGLTADSEVYVSPQLESTGEEMRYTGVEQALLLAWGTQVRKGSARDELQGWQVAAYAEAVLSQPRSQFMLQAAALLHKVRHERGRPRTRERSLLAMELLMEALRGTPSDTTPIAPPVTADGPDDSTPSAFGTNAVAVSRVPLSFAVWFPLQLQLRKELAEHYVSMGFIGAALKQYEALHLWDSLIVCYRLLDKRSAADNLIKERLKVTPDDPKLWCALGDLHLDDKHYLTAWERSGHRNARSQRSLGHSAMRRKDLEAAIKHYKLALALNPLNAQAWFALGYCHMKQLDPRNALRAFCQVTQQEPDNGEAWHNCAALWLQLGHADRAFSAQAEALRSKRDSWQAWENYALAAVGCGHLLQAARGLKQTLTLSQGQRLKVEILVSLLDLLDPPQTVFAANAPSVTGIHPATGGAPQQGICLTPGAGQCAKSDAACATAGKKDDIQEEDDLLSGLVFDLQPLHLAGGTSKAAGHAAAAADIGKGDSEDKGLKKDANIAEELDDTNGQTADPFVTTLDVLQDARLRCQLLDAIGSLLRDAVNSPACVPAVWGCLGRYYGMRGELESQKEALLKQVRGLQSSSAYKVEEDKFVELAVASHHLIRAYLQLHNLAAVAAATGAGNSSGLKQLGAARMHIKSFLKATAPNFANHEKYEALTELLKEVEAWERQS